MIVDVCDGHFYRSSKPFLNTMGFFRLSVCYCWLASCTELLYSKAWNILVLNIPHTMKGKTLYEISESGFYMTILSW